MAKENLMDRLKKSSTLKTTAILKDSKFFTQTDLIHTDIPAMDILFSGDIDGGFIPGITTWAGASKSFKTMFSLIMAKKYMDKYPDAILMYYDNEFGTPIDYFNSLDIDTERVLHIPILNLEELKFDLVKQLTDIERGDKVIIVVDSIGNIASKKEVDDAIDEKSVADMTRAKQIKSLFRMITPYMKIKNIPCVVICHVYSTQELYCLKGDTLIRTSSGLKEIKDIEVGEYVYALNGLKEVTEKFLPHQLPAKDVKFMKLTFDDGSIIECTDTHKFLMEDGEWKPASGLTLSDNFK